MTETAIAQPAPAVNPVSAHKIQPTLVASELSEREATKIRRGTRPSGCRGPRAELTAAIRSVLPGAELSDPASGTLDETDYPMKFSGPPTRSLDASSASSRTR